MKTPNSGTLTLFHDGVGAVLQLKFLDDNSKGTLTMDEAGSAHQAGRATWALAPQPAPQLLLLVKVARCKDEAELAQMEKEIIYTQLKAWQVGKDWAASAMLDSRLMQVTQTSKGFTSATAIEGAQFPQGMLFVNEQKLY